MKLQILRYRDDGDTTLGVLMIDGKFECYTLEDQHRTKKVYSDTRISEGTYTVKIRTFGGHHERYSKSFSFHKGMLQIMDVPNFTDILIHIGNDEEDTAGCPLVGQEVSGDRLVYSTLAYTYMYKKVIKAFDRGESVTIDIVDLERK